MKISKEELNVALVTQLRGFSDAARQVAPAGDEKQKFLWKRQHERIFKLCEFWLAHHETIERLEKEQES